VRVTGRTPVSLGKKLNPLWWFGNDAEQTVDEAPWYHPEWPEWRRYLYWNAFRNPLQNFRSFVIGVQDRNYEVEVIAGNSDPMVVQRDDVGELGWQIAVLEFASGVWLPFISYSGRRLVLQIGWQPTGFATLKLNLKG